MSIDPRYAHLDDPAEREWLTNVSPADVAQNAHRIYEFMEEAGLPADSYTRELAFTKASEALHITYEVLYDAWLNGVPVKGLESKPNAAAPRGIYVIEGADLDSLVSRLDMKATPRKITVVIDGGLKVKVNEFTWSLPLGKPLN